MAAQTPRAGPPEGFAEFAQLARLLTEQEEAGAANTLQNYFDGTKEPGQLCGSILILGGGHATSRARSSRRGTAEQRHGDDGDGQHEQDRAGGARAEQGTWGLADQGFMGGQQACLG